MALTEEQLIEARHKLAAGRITAYKGMPYFTRALMAIEPRSEEGFGTFAVDSRWRLYYDPVKCLEWTVQELAAVWLHEVNHLVRNHAKRFANLQGVGHKADIFNAAGDASINTDLRNQGFILPNPSVRFYADKPNPLSKRWKKGMTAEEMYWKACEDLGLLPDEEDASQNETSQDDQSDKDEKEDQQSQQDSGDSENADGESDDSDSENLDGDDSGEGSEDEEGSGESGKDSPDEESDSSDSKSQGQDGEPNTEEDDESGSEGSQAGNGDTSGDEDEPGGEEGSSSGSGNGSSDDDSSESEGTNQSGQGNSSGSKDADSDDTDDTGGESSVIMDKNGNPIENLPDCGSCVDNERRDYESRDDEDGSVDPSTAEWIRKKTAEDIVEHEKGNPGSVGSDLLREAREVMEPIVDWRKDFANFVRRVAAKHSGYSDFSYRRPSKKAQPGVILPSMASPPPPNIGIVIDSSGSMGEKTEIAAGLGEVKEIITRFGRSGEAPGIYVITCDAKAHVQKVKSIEEINLFGGGGTDMRVGIDKAVELKPFMDIIITITDGHTPWHAKKPVKNPKAIYIALITGEQGNTKSVPKWMKVIQVTVSRGKRKQLY